MQCSNDLAVISFNDVPKIDPTRKYSWLGKHALKRLETYCTRKGYTFVKWTDIPTEKPACWSKFPAILAAFEAHEWVLWVDSDCLILDMDSDLLAQLSLSKDIDIISQSPTDLFEIYGYDAQSALEKMPLNSGAIFLRRSEWSVQFLKDSWSLQRFAKNEDLWNGLGDQEAMISVLKNRSARQGTNHIEYCDFLHAHPGNCTENTLFAHLWGNRAERSLSEACCNRICKAWEPLIAKANRLPIENMEELHLSVVQCKLNFAHCTLVDADMLLLNSVVISHEECCSGVH